MPDARRNKRANRDKQNRATATDIAAQINATLGAGSIGLGSDPRFIVGHLATGVLPVDCLLGGGLPRGRFTEIYGDFSSLKSYIGLSAIGSCQEDSGTAVLVDTEHSFDPEWAQECGVQVEDLIVQTPETGEEAVDATQIALSMGADLIVWDSVAATQPRAEAGVQLSGDKNIQPARLAALMSTALRRLNTTNQNTAVLCINQTRSKVGVFFGPTETTPGGKALSFYASQRVRLSKAGRIKRSRKSFDSEGKGITIHDTIAQKIKCELIKSKLSIPEKEVWFNWDLVAGEVDEVSFLTTVAMENNTFRGRSYKEVYRLLMENAKQRSIVRLLAMGER